MRINIILLSYLFAGPLLDLGQAPRIDEGRDEKLYEIAFEQIPKDKSTILDGG
jgi:uncharacterized protein (DUF2126 family)